MRLVPAEIVARADIDDADRQVRGQGAARRGEAGGCAERAARGGLQECSA